MWPFELIFLMNLKFKLSCISLWLKFGQLVSVMQADSYLKILDIILSLKISFVLIVNLKITN